MVYFSLLLWKILNLFYYLLKYFFLIYNIALLFSVLIISSGVRIKTRVFYFLKFSSAFDIWELLAVKLLLFDFLLKALNNVTISFREKYLNPHDKIDIMISIIIIKTHNINTNNK